MKKLRQIKKTADGFLKKYEMTYDVDGEEVLWDAVSVNELRGEEDIAKRATGVTIIARFEDGDILVCEEFRFAVNDFCWEFPGGIIDPGESPEQAAIRELKEETGLEVVSVDRVLPRTFLGVGMTDASMVPVFLTVRGTIQGQRTAWEDIRPRKLSPAQVRELLAREDLKITQVCMLSLLFYLKEQNRGGK